MSQQLSTLQRAPVLRHTRLLMTLKFDFTGHSALVTAGTGGIGGAIAEALCNSGANVVIHGRAPEAAVDEVLGKCRQHGARASFVAADLFQMTEKTVDDVFNTAIAAEPNIDLLVNNAGGCAHFGPFVDVTFEQYHRMLNFNYTFGYFLTQRFVRHWLKNKTRGRVVMTGSINGSLAEPGSSLYDSLKAGVGMLVKSLASELAGQGIRINGFAPGMVITPYTNWLRDRKDDAAWIRLHTPNGQLPEPDSCVGAALFLLSDAAEHVHGHMLFVDGGMSAWQQPGRPANFKV